MMLDSSLFGDNVYEIQAEAHLLSGNIRIHIKTYNYGINPELIYWLIPKEIRWDFRIEPSVDFVWAYKKDNMMIYAFDISIV